LCWMGQCELIARILWCRKWAHSRTLHKGFQTAVGQLELISDIRTFNPWANSIILPCSTSAAGPHESLMRQPILCWMGQCALIARILWCRKWAHARTLHKGFQTAVGQPELIILISSIRAFNPWVNLIIFPSSGPAAGPRKSLMRQPFLCWMGQCELIAQILWHRKWAHARTLHKGFQTAVGQLKLISNIRAFNPWANSIILPRTTPTAGPCEHLVRQPVLCWMGQCELIAQILWHRKWAHARTLHKGFQTAVGQLELISSICAFNPWANSIIFPSSTPAAGPCECLVRQPILCWMGQCELIARILWHRKWAYSRTLHKGFQTAVGQLELISDIHAFYPWANSIIFPSSTPAAGPHESLMRQPVAFWMGLLWASSSSSTSSHAFGL